MLSDHRPEREPRAHTPPEWVADQAVFFITINCRVRGRNQLADKSVAESLFSSIDFYHQNKNWFPEIVLLMPDHLHALMSFSWDEGKGIAKVISNWKRYTARQWGIEWQRDFFDHRIRSEKDHQQTWVYIRENPVRVGLVDHFSNWDHVWFPDERQGWGDRR